MKLVAQLGPQFIGVRNLNEAEISEHAKYVPVIEEARSRLNLFKILQMNYREWREYLDSLLSLEPSDETQELELNRLLLNYLASAYAIREHFNDSHKRRFRHDPARKNSHEDFIEKLCANSFAFAFFLDFRDYVQHRALAIGDYNKTVTSTSVTFSITQNAARLLSDEKRCWRKSKLSTDKGDLDLVDLLQEFHVQMLQSYAKFVVETFFPELIPAAEFYGNLCKEVQHVRPGFRMVFVDDIDESNLPQFEITAEQVPNDLFQKLGISVKGTAF